MKFTDRILNAIGLERKSAPQDRPDYGRGSYFNYPSYRGWESFFGHRDTAIDYRRECGPLDSSSLVMAIVNWTGINLAEALPVVTKPDKKGVPQIELEHEAADLIRRPNPYSIWADDCLAGALSWWIAGNWYMKKVRDVSGQLRELWYIPHFLIEPRWAGDGRSPEVPASEVNDLNQYLSHYQYSIPGKEPILWPATDVVHIKRGKNLANPRLGIGAFDSVLTEIYGDNAVARFSATIMKNMGMVRYILTPKDKENGPNETQARAIQEQFIQSTSGENSNKPLVSTGAFDVTRLGFNAQELDLKELRNVPESRVAGVTGIPAIVLQFLVGLSHGHYGAAYEQAREQGYESVIIPIQNHLSEDLTWQVLPEIDKTKGARITFDISKVRVLAEDRDALYKRESDALRSGGITIDQFLASLGKEPIGSPMGDIRYIPSTSTPMSPERLLEASTQEPQQPAKPIDAESLAKFADMDRYFYGPGGLQDQIDALTAKQ